MRTRARGKRGFQKFGTPSPGGNSWYVVRNSRDVVGAARTRDALNDAIDVNVQKARSALFFSSNRVRDLADLLAYGSRLRSGPQVPATLVSLPSA